MKNKESGSSLRLTGREETTTAEIKMKTEALVISGGERREAPLLIDRFTSLLLVIP